MHFPILHTAEVEGVHRLAVLKHDVVGNIHQVVNGPHACVTDTFAHPDGRRSNLNIAHHACGVAAAERRLLHDDLRKGVDVPTGLCLYYGGVEFQGLVEGDGCFARETDHAEAVRAVRSDLELHNVVVHAKHHSDVITGLHILVEDKNTVCDAVREFRLLRMQIGKAADMLFLRIKRYQIAFVLIVISAKYRFIRSVQVKPDTPAIPGADNSSYPCCNHRPVNPVAGCDVR